MGEAKAPSLPSLESLIEQAIKQRASDIHMTPGRVPIVRVDGELILVKDWPVLTPAMTQTVAQQMTTGEQWEKFVKDRELDFSLSQHKISRFRANLSWQRGSVSIALRSIPHEIPTFEQLGLPSVLKKFAEKDHGLFLVTGPTGSGKSTTLAAMVDYINETRSCHIVTIEDPIEYLHRHKKSLVSQREMHHDTLSFPEALRHVLRQDPDVILIGEMRDLETVETALMMAETGHLVLATLHTGDTSQALTRIIDIYSPHQQAQARTQLSLSLIGIMAQELLRRVDQRGRVLAYEVLVNTPGLAHMIRANEIHQVYTSIQTGAGEGMCTLNSSLVKLYKSRIISREDALQKSVRQKELLDQINPFL